MAYSLEEYMANYGLLDDLDKPPTKREKLDPTLSDGLICKKKEEKKCSAFIIQYGHGG